MHLRIIAGMLFIGMTAGFCCGQGVAPLPSGATSSLEPHSNRQALCGSVAIVKDPFTHVEWVAMRERTHPAGPARMIAIPAGSDAKSVLNDACPGKNKWIGPAAPSRMIRAGDMVTLEQRGSGVRAVLQARALGPAALGGEFRAQLKSTGRILVVLADGPAHARLPSGGSEAER